MVNLDKILDFARRGTAAAAQVVSQKYGSDEGLLTKADLTKQEKKSIEFARQGYLAPEDRNRKVHGYIYDEDLSDEETGIWHHKKSGKVYMTSRGTANAKDAFTSDIDIIKKGAPKARIDSYNKKVDAVLAKYKESRGKISGVGHSLGASIQLAALHERPELYSKVMAIAPGLSPVTGLDDLAKQKALVQDNQDKLTILGRRNDVVWSAGESWMKGQKNFRQMKAVDKTLKGAANNHFLSAFYEKLPQEELAEALKKHGFSKSQIDAHVAKFAGYGHKKAKQKVAKVLARLGGSLNAPKKKRMSVAPKRKAFRIQSRPKTWWSPGLRVVLPKKKTIFRGEHTSCHL